MPSKRSPARSTPHTERRRKRTLDELRYEFLFQTMDEGAVYSDDTGTILAVNPVAERTFGLPKEQLIGKRWADIPLDPCDESGKPVPYEERPLVKAVRTGTEQRGVIMGVVNQASGERRWLKIQAVPFYRGDEKQPSEAYSVFTDITEERAYRQNLELLRAISDSSTDLLFAKDRAHRMIFANPAVLATMRKNAADVMGKSYLEIFPDTRMAREIMAHDREVLEQGKAVLVEESTGDAPPRVFLAKKTPYRDASGRVIGLLGIAREITDRKREAQERQRLLETIRTTAAASEASRRQLEAVFQSMDDGVMLFDPSGRILMVNRAQARISGYADTEAMKRDVDRLASYFEFFRPDGSPIEMRDWPVSRVLRGESLSQVEAIVRRVDSGEERHFSFSGEPIRDEQGTQVLGVVVSRDITEAKKGEIALREEDRRKDEFIGVLSHELRNPLGPMLSALYILDRVPPGSDDARRSREVIGRQVKHLARLVDDLLDVTRIASGKAVLKLERLDLAGVVRQAGEDHRELLKAAGLEFAVSVPEHPVWVNGDGTRLAQILGNLLQNAIRFSSPPASVELALVAPGERAEVRVRDTGRGIDPSLQDRLFLPFMQGPQDLARAGGGLGLGLALVKGLTELHGGSVCVHSEGLGKGTEFVLELPLAAAPAAERRGDARAASARGRRVLVVDDNHDAAHSLASVVRMFGHETEIAYDGEQTVKLAHQWRPDVILCDIGLPVMDGYQVAGLIRSDPELAGVRLIALSGYAQPQDRSRSKEAGFDAHIAKPADPELIQRTLASL